MIALLMMLGAGVAAEYLVIPPPKSMRIGEQKLEITTAELIHDDAVTPNEIARLEEILQANGITFGSGGTRISIGIGSVETSARPSRYADKIQVQSYKITISDDGIELIGGGDSGLFHAIGTLDQLLANGTAPHVRILDWPDLPVRMIMVDSARQNESMDYYRRLIVFASRNKINSLLVHLTDDQTSALFHEDFPELMHELAWQPEEVRQLVQFAASHHIELIPEIESLGHSRMFERLPDFGSYLHQTKSQTPNESWMGTSIPGYTNVLCPASPAAIDYLKTMYDRSSELFPHPWLHIGFDEVDMTECNRCIEAFGEQTHEEWMATALRQAIDIASLRDRKAALWGDMLLSHREVISAISPEEAVIFDWYYRPDVTDESVFVFKDRGFEVIACPALVAAPHMVIPDRQNYDNIERFTRIAREHDLLGVNTTIWVPVRYMSDALWPGVAFAAGHAWSGSDLDESALMSAFARDFFQTTEGVAFHHVWSRMADVIWHRPDFYAGCWVDETSLESARIAAISRQQEIRDKIAILESMRQDLARIGETVRAHPIEWQALEDSAAILQFSMEHLLAAPNIPEDVALLESLNAKCRDLIAVIEADWDRNRYSDDPGKEGRFLQNQHLLFRLGQVHRFHELLLSEAAAGSSGPQLPAP
jgi:hypothetical protein